MKKELVNDAKYLDWLHELTQLGYEEGLIFQTKNVEIVESYYLENKTPKDALSAYKEYLSEPNILVLSGNIRKGIEDVLKEAYSSWQLKNSDSINGRTYDKYFCIQKIDGQGIQLLIVTDNTTNIATFFIGAR